jgi:hypothetical protein
MVNTMLLAFELLFGLTAERSSLTIALTLGASSSHDEKLLVTARSTSLINSCPRCAISLAPLGEIRTTIPK